jgi:hypothetical protein
VSLCVLIVDESRVSAFLLTGDQKAYKVASIGSAAYVARLYSGYNVLVAGQAVTNVTVYKIK